MVTNHKEKKRFFEKIRKILKRRGKKDFEGMRRPRCAAEA